MIKQTVAALMATFFFSTGCGAGTGGYSVLDLEQEKKMPLSQAVADLKKSRIVVVGEHHNNVEHHRAQLAVIRSLKDAGIEVAIGLEMFRRNSQADLDRWVAGEIDRQSFEKIYYDNWTFPWQTYGMIFEYARDQKVPMIGLNVPREITRKVSRDGFKSLSEEQKGQLAEVSCIVDQQYMDYIRQAFGGHSHGKLNFIHFCEAQMVWDTAMAVYTLDYLEKHPDVVVVLLTGVGHAQKGAVPRQIEMRSQVPYTVILPEVPGGIDRNTVTAKEAHYLMLDLD
jgi:uncharacterized iron-regulated protein